MNRLYRSATDRRLFGVCGGIAQFFRIDSTLVRIGVVLLILFTGVPLLLYFLLAIIVPKEPVWHDEDKAFASGYGFQSANNLDREMEHMEKRAMQQEICRLREELAKYKFD